MELSRQYYARCHIYTKGIKFQAMIRILIKTQFLAIFISYVQDAALYNGNHGIPHSTESIQYFLYNF